MTKAIHGRKSFLAMAMTRAAILHIVIVIVIVIVIDGDRETWNITRRFCG